MILENPCTVCTGTGKTGYFGMYDWVSETCYACDGHGTVPTADGEMVLDFVRRRLVVKTELKG